MNVPALNSVEIVLLFIGSWLVVRGWRGRPVWSTPSCAKCRYDLRGPDQATTTSCPECGADLRRDRSVRFGRWKRQPRVIVVRALVFLIPIGWMGANATLRAMGKTWRDFRSNASVIAELSTAGNNRPVWDDVINRYREGELSEADIAAVVGQVIKEMNKGGNRGMGLQQPKGFIEALNDDGRLTVAQKSALSEASIAADPPISMRSKVRQGSMVKFRIDGGVGGAGAMPGGEVLLSVRSIRCGERVLINGDKAPVDVTGISRPDRFSAVGRFQGVQEEFQAVLEPGTHEIVFEIDMGVIDAEANAFGMLERPGPVEQWPTTLHRRLATVKLPLTVLPPDQSPIEMIHDASLTAAAKKVVVVRRVVIRTLGGSERISAEVKVSGRPPIALACDVIVQVNGQELKTGTFHAQGGGSGQSGAGPVVADLPPEVTTATVILRPSEIVAEGISDFESICGDELVFHDVPLKRLGGERLPTGRSLP